MENVTKPNTTILLNKNKSGVTITRRNFKNRACVTVRGPKNHFITNYRFDNIELPYKTKYMNWQNLDHCEGWVHSKEELVNQFIQNKKLFADFFIKPDTKKSLEEYNGFKCEFESVKNKIKECETMENVIVHYHKNEDDHIDVTLVKKGCVADYIDVEQVLELYANFNLYLDNEEFNELMDLAHHPMVDFVNRGLNKFKFDFANPKSDAEFIFNGMLLGYAIESTVARIYG